MGTASLIALIVIAGLIALFIWQPWSGMTTVRATTVTTPSDGIGGAH